MDRLTDQPEALTDDELCDLLRISRVTLWRQLKKRPKQGVGTIHYVLVGSERRWSRASALAFLNGK